MLKLVTLFVIIGSMLAMFCIGFCRYEVVKGRIKNTLPEKTVLQLAACCTGLFTVSLVASSGEWAIAFLEWFLSGNSKISGALFLCAPVLLTMGVMAFFALLVMVANFGSSVKYYRLAKRARERRMKRRIKAQLLKKKAAFEAASMVKQ